MQTASEPDFATQIAAAMDWWREAGVEDHFTDEPAGWITAPAEIEPPRAEIAPKFVAPQPAVEIRIGEDQSEWPTTLAEFNTWWLSEPTLDNGQISARLPPRGAAGAELMVLVDHPEVQDRDILLSGPQGKLLSAMLKAMGITEEVAYFASALSRHTPMPDWAALHRDGLGEVMAHHIHLAAPKRLIVFGRNVASLVSSPIGHDPAKSAETLPRFNHEGSSVPMLVTMTLDRLLSRPLGKAGFWNRWLEWTET